jgi:hypothetical protein
MEINAVMKPENKNIQAWLMLAKETRQHGGNLGYDDSAAEYYSWDSTVPNHSEPKIHDKIVIWDGETLVGTSVIQGIDVGSSKKIRLRCPHCNMTKIKQRHNTSPKYRCHNPECRTEFENPKQEIISVTTYRSNHPNFWYDLHGQLEAEELREICKQPKSQHSLRPLKWLDFLEAIGKEFSHNLEAIDNLKMSASGHRNSKTRVRLGQSKFRKEMLKQFGDMCALSGLSHIRGLDAAHLYSYADLGEHHYNGGLLLRKDLHKLFDLGLIVVEPSTMTIRLSASLQKVPQYKGLDGTGLKVAINGQTKKWLKLHWDEHHNSLTEI